MDKKSFEYKLQPKKILNNFHFIYFKLAEVSGAARINLQPAEQLLFCKHFSKMCPSALRVSDLPGSGGRGSWGQNCTKIFVRQVGMWVQNFIKINVGVWISIRRPHIPTDKHLYANLYIYIYIDFGGVTYV